jgi:two-component system, OmpR family, sensor histidine kinase BaeS
MDGQPDMNSADTHASTPGPLRRGLDTLRVKLFLAIAGAHVVLVAAVYLIYSWSFDKGLVEYVNRSEQARLAPVISQLADGYRQQGNWNWVTEDREAWLNVLREVLGWRVGRQGGFGGNGGGGGHGVPSQDKPDRDPQRERDRVPRFLPDDSGPLPPVTIDWRVMLLDAGDKVLIPYPGGGMADMNLAVKLPIRVDNQVVGYLGYIPRLRLVESLESITAKQQSRRLGVIGLGMLAAVLLNAFLIASWLSRRLHALGQGATALARGDYSTRIKVQGHDELARLANDFNHLALALEAAQRGRQQWIADIAHELRTPLTTLRAEIEAVQDGVRPLTQASMASIAQEVHRLARLVEDLRLLTLSDLGALTYRKEPLLLAEVIDDALAAGRAAIEDKALTVTTQLDAALVVDADADRLAQVFANLLQNTLRYSQSPARLAITLAAEAGEACIDWEDSSPGVGDADLPRLTDRLYRVDDSRSSSSGGSGLGLAIVQAIVHAHGGRMQASHGALGGLHWRIWLPLSDDPPA